MPEKRKTLAGFEGNTREIEVTVPDGEPAIWGADAKLRVVGTRVPRVDGLAKATGAAVYTADVRLPGMLHARFLRAPCGGGRIASLDLAAAEKAPGVRLARAILKTGDPLLMEGMDVALVVADTEDRAEDAVALCRLAVEQGPVLVREEDAMADGAPPVHAGGRGNVNPAKKPENPQGPAAFYGKADVVLSATYRTQVQTHSALEPHGVVVRPDEDGGVTVWVSTQGTFNVRDAVKGALRLQPSMVRVVAEHVGGGFGAKLHASAPGSGFVLEVARVAVELKAPVRAMLDRREEHLLGGNRPSSVQKVGIGIRKDGTVTAYEVDCYGTAGISPGGGGARNPMIYDLGAGWKGERTVVTHAGPAFAFRAPGHPQGSFALESILDEAAHAIGMDPLDLRRKIDRNPVRLAQYDEGAKRIGWREKRRVPPGEGRGPLKRGVGMGSAIWYSGGGAGSTVLVTVHRDGSVEVSNGAQDIGTGTRTVLAVIVAEVLGLDPAGVRVNLGDTRHPYGPGSGGSQTAASLGPCARAAAEKAREEVLGKASRVDPKAWKAACARMEGDSKTFPGTRADPYQTFVGGVAGCQFAEVEVDVETGVVRVVRVVALQDCGRVVDRLTAESQVIGGVIGGIGYALFEERVLDPATGRMLNADLEAYRLAGPRDVPDVEAVLTDVANAGNCVGMMGLGEPPAIPTAGAIANAVFHATGARVRTLPLTPARVLAALEEAARKKEGK